MSTSKGKAELFTKYLRSCADTKSHWTFPKSYDKEMSPDGWKSASQKELHRITGQYH